MTAARILAAVAIALLAMSSCSDTPSGVVKREKMARIIADLNIADAVVSIDRRGFTGDSSRLALKQSIYARNGVSAEEVDSSLRWYGYHMDEYLKVYDRAIEIVEADIARTRDISGTTVTARPSGGLYETEGDSVDVWNRERLRRFDVNSPSNIMTFHIVSDRNCMAGDVYTLALRTTGARMPVRLAITAGYTDGTAEYIASTSDNEGRHSIDLALDPDKSVSQVYGYIAVSPEVAGREMIADSISLVRRRKSVATPQMRAGAVRSLAPYGY